MEFQDIQWFRLFYLLAIGLGAVLVVRAARRDGLPLSAALALFLWAAVFGILGSRLVELSPEGFWEFLRTGRAPDMGKTSLGGILGAMIGLAIGRKLMGISSSVWGWFAAWPAVLIVFRMGCLAVGCCAGAPTNLPWALSFAAHSPACELQIAQGLLSGHASHSLGAHPVPIYEMLFGIAMLLLMYRLLRQGWQRNSLFFLSLLGYGGFRIVEEFIRVEHVATGFLNPVQLALLVAMPVLAWFLWRSLRHTVTLANVPHREWLAIAIPLGIIALSRHFWSTGEFLAIGGMVLAYGIVKGLQFLRAQSAERLHLRWVAPACLLAGTLLMSQAAIDQTVPADSEASIVELGMGASVGRYQETCGDNHQFAALGAGAQYTHNWGGKHQIDAGARGFYGYDEDATQRLSIFGGNPFIAYQNRFVGVEVGAAMGNLITNGSTTNFLPTATLRLGPSDIFFAEGRLLNNSAFTPIPGSIFRIGIGSGFGLKNGTVFKIGVGMDGFYANSSIVINKQFVIEPMVAAGDNTSYMFGLGLRVKLGL